MSGRIGVTASQGGQLVEAVPARLSRRYVAAARAGPRGADDERIHPVVLDVRAVVPEPRAHAVVLHLGQHAVWVIGLSGRRVSSERSALSTASTRSPAISSSQCAAWPSLYFA